MFSSLTEMSDYATMKMAKFVMMRIILGGDAMHYYPGDPSGYRGENRYPKGLDQPEEGSRSVERIYSTKGGEKKLIRENIYEYHYGTTKSGQKRKRGKYILVETINYATDKE